MQFGLTPGSEMTDGLFVRRMQSNIAIKGKSHICVLWMLKRHAIKFQEKDDGVGNEKERFARINCKSNDETPSQSKDES